MSTPSDFGPFAQAPFERLATVELHADDARTLVVQLSNDSATSDNIIYTVDSLADENDGDYSAGDLRFARR